MSLYDNEVAHKPCRCAGIFWGLNAEFAEITRRARRRGKRDLNAKTAKGSKRDWVRLGTR